MANQSDFHLEDARRNVETLENWRSINKSMLYLHFPPEIEVKILLPTGGATGRFLCRLAEKGENGKTVSVYLDHFSRLGCMDQAYWEIYPNTDGDCTRFWLNETEELFKGILASLQTPP